jgi:hypothetical protein
VPDSEHMRLPRVGEGAKSQTSRAVEIDGAASQIAAPIQIATALISTMSPRPTVLWIWSVEDQCVSPLPVAASTAMVPVICGCSEQKYS